MAHIKGKGRPDPVGGTVKKFVAIGGVAALAYIGIRRMLGGGADWQPTDEVEEDPIVD